MILLTRLDDTDFILNSDHILWIDHTPDTVITLVSGLKVMVKESIDQVVAKTVEFRRHLYRGVAVHGASPTPTSEIQS